MRSQEARVWRGPFTWSVALHLLLGLSLLLSLERDQPIDAGAEEAPGPVIQATAVDAREVDAAHEALAERERRREEAAREAQREAERRAREEEQARQAAEAQREREAREAERQRQQALERQRAEEERRQQEAEEQRRREEEEARRRAEEEEARRQAEAEERRRQEELERQRAEEERRQREAEEAMQAAAEAEERRRREAAEQRRIASLEAQYAQQIRAHVERHWIRPSDVPEDLSCEVVARQIPGGEVVDVRVRDCNAPASVVRSIETAVYRSSPLPSPPEEAVFRQTIQFTFRGE
jgi:colicin import membrane protein